MTNRYFNNTLDLIGGTKARASDVEDNFTAVDDGFDVVQAEMDAKAPLASPALTGVPTAPTAPNGTSNYQIATTQFVTNQAFTSVLPGQGGNAGKVLSTNGTAASWEVNTPAWGNVTGKPTTLAGYSIDPASARTELGATTVGNGVFTAATAAAGRTALGATTVGANVFTAADALAARTALGGGLIGQDVFIAATAAAARTAMGVTPVNIGAAASGANTDITSLGAVTGVTATLADNTTKLATTAFVIANAPVLAGATETAAGKIELANAAEVIAGTDAVRAITPAGLRSGLNASGTAPVYVCRAWVNFNGTGTVAIRASGNVSSITDNGVGDYAVNFTTAMPNANYSVAATTTQRGGGGSPSTINSVGFGSAATSNADATYASTAVRIYVQQSNGVALDAPTVSLAIFG